MIRIEFLLLCIYRIDGAGSQYDLNRAMIDGYRGKRRIGGMFWREESDLCT